MFTSDVRGAAAPHSMYDMLLLAIDSTVKEARPSNDPREIDVIKLADRILEIGNDAGIKSYGYITVSEGRRGLQTRHRRHTRWSCRIVC